MPAIDAATLPLWAQQLCAVAGVVVPATWLALKERKKRKREDDDDTAPNPNGGAAQVLASSIVDTRAIKDAADALGRVDQRVKSFMEQQHDDSRAMRGAIEDMTDAVNRNTNAQGQGAITPVELMALIGKLSK